MNYVKFFMNKSDTNLLKEMGIGPIWKLRQNPHLPDPLPQLLATTPSHRGDSMSVRSDESFAPLASAISPLSECSVCNSSDQGARDLIGAGALPLQYLLIGEDSADNGNAQGQPLVGGTSDALLDNMLRALGVQRGGKAYIASIIKSSSGESYARLGAASKNDILICLPCLKKQIAFMRPSMILALGKTAAVALLELSKETSLNSLRGVVHEYQGLPLVVTYHPAYLLRQPKEKSHAWSDLCLAMRSFSVG